MIGPWNIDAQMLVAVLVSACVVLLLLRYKVRKLEAQELRRILDILRISHKRDRTWYVLLLDAESPSYSVMDQILSQPLNKKLTIVLWAPTWLVRAKSASWANHQVIDPDQCSECWRFHHKVGRIYVFHHGRVKEEVKESVQFLQDIQNQL